jgi:hypothetical protein
MMSAHARRDTTLGLAGRSCPVRLMSRGRMSVLRDLAAVLFMRNGWHLIPIVVVLGLFGLFLISAQGSVVAPFIYTLF